MILSPLHDVCLRALAKVRNQVYTTDCVEMHKSLVKLASAISSPWLRNESYSNVSVKHMFKIFYEADKTMDATRAGALALTLWNELIPVAPQTSYDTLAVLAIHLTVAAILHDLHNWSESFRETSLQYNRLILRMAEYESWTQGRIHAQIIFQDLQPDMNQIYIYQVLTIKLRHR